LIVNHEVSCSEAIVIDSSCAAFSCSLTSAWQPDPFRLVHVRLLVLAFFHNPRGWVGIVLEPASVTLVGTGGLFAVSSLVGCMVTSVTSDRRILWTSRAYSRVDEIPKCRRKGLSISGIFSLSCCVGPRFTLRLPIIMPADVRKMNPSALSLADTLAGAGEDASGRW
jgi:hypothetical protein